MNSRDRQAWIIAVGLFVSLFFLWGSGYNTSPVFLSALLKAFGWSHSKASWLPSVLVLAVGITGPMTGWLLDHFDARAVMGIGGLLTGGGFIAASRATTFTELLIAYVVLGVGLGTSAWMPASVVIANWFGERRGTALGVVTAGMESGGMVMALVVGYIISHYGWSDAYFALSIPVFLLVVPFLAIFLGGKPSATVQPQPGASSETLPGYEVGEAIRTRVFWMLALAQVLWGLSVPYCCLFDGYRLHAAVRYDRLRHPCRPGRTRQTGLWRHRRPYRWQERARNRAAADRSLSHTGVERQT